MRAYPGARTGDPYGPWHRHNLVFIDFETTGFDAGVDRVIEVGLIRFEQGQIVDSFGSLIYPERLIPDYAARVHGITDAGVATAPRFIDVLPRIIRICDNAWPCAFSESFDRRFLQMETERTGLTDISAPMFDSACPWIDPLVWAQTLDDAPGNKLIELCEFYGIVPPDGGWHRALGDARCAGLVLFALAKKLGHCTLSELLRLQNVADAGRQKKRERKRAIANKLGVFLLECRMCGSTFDARRIPRHMTVKVHRVSGELAIDDLAPLCSKECADEVARAGNELQDEFKYVYNYDATKDAIV